MKRGFGGVENIVTVVTQLLPVIEQVIGIFKSL